MGARINSRAKGLTAERAVANYLVAQGEPWLEARRSVATGWSTKSTEHLDEGDIAGTPGLCFQVKNLARPLSGKLLIDTWRETQDQARPDTRVPLIIEKRAGSADVGRWWLHTGCRWYVRMVTGAWRWTGSPHLVRVEVGDVINDLRLYSIEIAGSE